MATKTTLIALLLALFACSEDRKAKDPEPDDRVQMAVDRYTELQDIAMNLRDQDTGWLDREGCDAMIWSGKYAAVRYTKGVDIEAALIEPGKWSRRPLPACWNEDEGDVGSKTTWSRDMCIAGLCPYIWRHDRIDLLEDHIAYGKENNWKMGDPIADGRSVYTPSLIGILYQMLFYMGGEDSPNRVWPSLYPKGLDDYQAHLQVMDIWIRGEIGERFDSADAMPAPPPEDAEVVQLKENSLSLYQGDGEPREGLQLDDGTLRLLSVSETMFERLKEHAAREPKCWTYQAMLGTYTGSQKPLLDLVESGEFDCSYARCDAKEDCETAEKLWALDLALRRLRAEW